MDNLTDKEIDKKRIRLSLVFPVFIMVLIWFVKFLEYIFDWKLVFLGIYPLKVKGLVGIVTAPLIHGSFRHLVDNSIPLFFLTWAVFYFYHKIALKIFLLGWFMTGLWVWFGARGAYHIGASGLIYCFGGFLFLSGVIRKNTHLMAISLLVVFTYGSMVWGIFPFKEEISWESHLMGLIAGIILAIYYRKEGPPIKKPWWEEEDNEDETGELNYYDFDTEGEDSK